MIVRDDRQAIEYLTALRAKFAGYSQSDATRAWLRRIDCAIASRSKKVTWAAIKAAVSDPMTLTRRN
jgi:hypothetical protein